jgi:hypothetical protein
MPVKKFRTLDEAERSLWREPGDPRIWDGVVRRWQLHRFFAREPAPRRRPGVFKYRSIEEKQRASSLSGQSY